MENGYIVSAKMGFNTIYLYLNSEFGEQWVLSEEIATVMPIWVATDMVNNWKQIFPSVEMKLVEGE